MKLTDGNDYAMAKLLYDVVLSIIASVRLAKEMDLSEDYEIRELNRVYVLLVNELEGLYEKNPKLTEITPEPFWRQFDVLETVSWKILDYLDDPMNDKGRAHLVRLNKLCIVTNNETPELTPEQLKLIEFAFEKIVKYRHLLDDTAEARAEESWYISEYWLDYEPNGTILINNVLKLKKTHIDSAIDKLLEQSIKSPNTLFVPDLGRTSRNLSTVLSSAGFDATLRQLFFPAASNIKGVVFRPTVTFEQATNDGIETTELDLLLKALGADLSFS